MRFLDMWRPLTFVGYDIASKEHIDETLRELFSVKPHVAAAFGIACAGLSAGLNGFAGAGIIATCIAFAGLLYRFLIQRYFKARQSATANEKLIRLFVISSTISAVTWGLCVGLLFHAASPPTQMLVIGVSCAIVQGAAGRAYMMPGSALLNITSVLGMLMVVGLAQGNYVVPPLCLIYFAFLASFLMKMVRNRIRQLEAERTARHLFQQVVEKNELLRVANEALAAKAHEDPLTGLANRRKFDIVFGESLSSTRARRTAISLMMIDVDHFKAFNDTYGHQAGDGCLQILSNAITRIVSEPGSLVARYGGEEFVIVLPDVDQAGALVIAEQIRLAVRFTNLADLPNSPPSQTVSIGIASCEAGTDASREEMLAAADAALYEAKKQGRNRICVDPGGPLALTAKA